MVVLGEGAAKEVGDVVANSRLHDLWALDDPVHDLVDDLELGIAEHVITVDEVVEKGSQWDRIFSGEVEDGGVWLTARDLEIDGEKRDFF